MSLTKIFDKVADALVPKEIAPYLGPIATMFAGPIGGKLAFALGQLGSAKMHSGKLDPYTALGTVMSARSFNARNPDFTSLQDRLGRGIGSARRASSMGLSPFESFKTGFNMRNPANVEPRLLRGTPRRAINPLRQVDNPVIGFGELQISPGDARAFGIDENIMVENTGDVEKMFDNIPVKSTGQPEITLAEKGSKFFDDISETIFPGFMDGDEFDLGRSLTTIGSVTSLTQIKNAAEALKKQRMKDEKEEGRIWREWFTKYESLSGKPYPEDNPSVADPYLIEKYNKYMLANGGRVGYNEGGGIMDVAPGIPKGMELDYRDSGGFIPMGSKEKKDDVPAVLAKNEFVLTSDAMKGLDKMMGGTGDPRAAAKYMYNMMDQLEAMA